MSNITVDSVTVGGVEYAKADQIQKIVSGLVAKINMLEQERDELLKQNADYEALGLEHLKLKQERDGLKAWQDKALILIDCYDVTRPEHDSTCLLRASGCYCDCYAKEQNEEFTKLTEETQK